MIKSKVEVEKYEAAYKDLVKILALGNNQKITDVVVSGGGRGASSPWSITFTVETTESKTVEVPSYTEK